MHLQECLVLVFSECKNWVLMLLVKLLELHLLLHSIKTPVYYFFHDLPFIIRSTVDPDEQNSTEFVRKWHVRKKKRWKCNMHLCLVATGGSACPLQALLLSIDVFDQLQQFKQTLRSSHTRPKYDGPVLGQEFFSHNCDSKRFKHSSWAIWFLRAIKSPWRAWHASSSGTPSTGYDSSFSNSLATLSSINCSISFHFASSLSFSCNSQDRR